ncbi:SAM-dependent methyltransferase [Microbacterium deminutum]|uniref:SAM-dependent methyltransferase n=1 Tax=Microbacterium deminutum TaxID=344164 RepID=A0ABN2Q3T1_9MICO
MTAVMPKSAEWQALREHADGRSRSRALAVAAARLTRGPIVVHDLGSGRGSMLRWLAPFLGGRQTWVLHDADPALLAGSPEDPAGLSSPPVVIRASEADASPLSDDALEGASLITASGLLDLITREEAQAIVRACVTSGAPALLTLTVTGRIRLEPVDPGDRVFESTFNDHQRRMAGDRRLLGPDAVGTVVDLFRDAGWSVRVADSAWQLDATDQRLIQEWLEGRVAGAVEERPALQEWADEYSRTRARQLADGTLRIVVDHQDILAWSP